MTRDSDDRFDDLVSVVVERADAWRSSVEQTKEARDSLVSSLHQACGNGVPEYALAKETGLHRHTIRRWLGKVK